MIRRRFLGLLGAAAGSLVSGRSFGQVGRQPATLLEVPLDLQGDWGQSSPRDGAAVIFRMRNACLSGASLRSDRQPTELRIENRASGNPAIWLHEGGSTTAWVVVNVGGRDWSKLAYQFGHELGHVMANSWDASSKPGPPCQWLEEALVEAFSLRGLGRLADSWERRPVFPNDQAFAGALRLYRRRIVEHCEDVAARQMPEGRFDDWFNVNRAALEGKGGPGATPEPAVPVLLRELERESGGIDDLGALNRWPGRTTVAIDRYLRLWQKSCDEIGVAGRLPARLQDLLGVG